MPSSWRRSPIRLGWLVALLRQLTGTGRPSGLQHGWLWRQKIWPGRSSGRPWRRTIGWHRRDSGKPSGTQEGEAVPYQHCFQWRWAAADLNWGYLRTVEGILLGSPQSHRHVFHWGSRVRGLGGGLVHHPSWSHRGSQEAWVLQMSGCGGAVLVDTPLQHRVVVGDSASGLTDNYRGITLLSLPGKVYARVLERRIRR